MAGAMPARSPTDTSSKRPGSSRISPCSAWKRRRSRPISVSSVDSKLAPPSSAPPSRRARASGGTIGVATFTSARTCASIQRQQLGRRTRHFAGQSARVARRALHRGRGAAETAREAQRAHDRRIEQRLAFPGGRLVESPRERAGPPRASRVPTRPAPPPCARASRRRCARSAAAPGTRSAPSARRRRSISGTRERAQTGVEDAARAGAGQEERLAHAGGKPRGGLLFDDEHAQASHREAHGRDQAGQRGSEHDDVPTAGAQAGARAARGHVAQGRYSVRRART